MFALVYWYAYILYTICKHLLCALLSSDIKLFKSVFSKSIFGKWASVKVWLPLNLKWLWAEQLSTLVAGGV